MSLLKGITSVAQLPCQGSDILPVWGKDPLGKLVRCPLDLEIGTKSKGMCYYICELVDMATGTGTMCNVSI